jgi:hypothetical protein
MWPLHQAPFCENTAWAHIYSTIVLNDGRTPMPQEDSFERTRDN